MIGSNSNTACDVHRQENHEHLKQVISCCYFDTEGINLSALHLITHALPMSTITSKILQFSSDNDCTINSNRCYVLGGN